MVYNGSASTINFNLMTYPIKIMDFWLIYNYNIVFKKRTELFNVLWIYTII